MFTRLFLSFVNAESDYFGFGSICTLHGTQLKTALCKPSTNHNFSLKIIKFKHNFASKIPFLNHCL